MESSRFRKYLNEFKISKSMSDQFWMHLSLDHWDQWGIKIYDL